MQGLCPYRLLFVDLDTFWVEPINYAWRFERVNTVPLNAYIEIDSIKDIYSEDEVKLTII